MPDHRSRCGGAWSHDLGDRARLGSSPINPAVARSERRECRSGQLESVALWIRASHAGLLHIAGELSQADDRPVAGRGDRSTWGTPTAGAPVTVLPIPGVSVVVSGPVLAVLG